MIISRYRCTEHSRSIGINYIMLKAESFRSSKHERATITCDPQANGNRLTVR